VRGGLWLPVGSSDVYAFYRATVDVILASRIALFLSAAFFILGVFIPSPALHPFFMVGGLLAFYFAVMYIQLPGFVNAVPARWATWLLLVLFLIGLAASYQYGYLPLLPFSLLYALLSTRHLTRQPTYYPNAITIAGLLLLPLSPTHIAAVASFPLASVYTLLYRIDSSRARLPLSFKKALVITASYLASWLLLAAGQLWALLIPSLVLTASAPPKPRDAYGVGSFLFRWLIALAPLHHHLMYMAFTVIMSALCAPYFPPSILYREMPNYKYELLTMALIAYIARALEIVELAALAVAALVLYVAVRLLLSKPVPLKPP